MTKTYQSLQFLIYQKVVLIDGRNVISDFTGGVTTPNRSNGLFTTSDEKLQKALEKDIGYGKAYICISKEPVKEEPIKEETPEVVKDEGEIDPIQFKAVKDIVNAQQARDYLAKTFEGVTYGMLKNKLKVLAIAEEYKIEFPDWDM